MLTVNDIKEKVTPIAKKYGIKEIYLFGSYSRGEANKNSDIDLLISPGEIQSFIGLASALNDLENVFGKGKVDILTINQLDHAAILKKEVLHDRILLYKGRNYNDKYKRPTDTNSYSRVL